MRTVALTVALLASACSFAGAGGPRPRDPAEINCGRELAAPIVDTAAVAGLIAATFVGYRRVENQGYYGAARTVYIGVPASLAFIYSLSATYGYVHLGKCRAERRDLIAEEARIEREQIAAAAKRRNAWQKTQEAARLARAGDCVAVIQLDAEVARIDAEFHATVFARDIAIARCLHNGDGGGGRR